MAVDPVGVLKDVLDFLGLEFTSDDNSKVGGGPDQYWLNFFTASSLDASVSRVVGSMEFCV